MDGELAEERREVDLLKKFSVLYVEDNEEIRSQLTDFFRRRMRALHVAPDGEQGLELFVKHRPDIVVSDILMPVMDGLKMVEGIRALDADIPVILTTAFNETDYFLRAIELGVDKYVLKPVNSDILGRSLLQVARVLAQRHEIEAGQVRMKTLLDDLQCYHDAAEVENQVAVSLMERMICADGLNDPLLRQWVLPTQLFSGDLVAAQRARSGDLFIMLADATGHGLAAAVNLLPLARIFYPMVNKGFSLFSLASEMNTAIREQSPADRFVAATLVRIDTVGRMVEVWNGGNPPAQFVDETGVVQHTFRSTSLPLGILDAASFDARTRIFHWDAPGQLFLSSDGLVDAENAAGEPFGAERLLAALTSVPAAERFQAVIQAVHAHLNGQRAHDDVSWIAVTCREEPVCPEHDQC